MKKIYALLLTLILHSSFFILHSGAQEKIILLNEGNWQADNGRMTYFENGKVVSNQWFRDNNGTKLGDTPNDIIQVNDNLLAVAINWSNIIQFITPQGKAVAATEEVPNNRKLCSDGEYVYVSSYGHECNSTKGMLYFTKGFVAKIRLTDYKVVDAVEVGYEPEGIALWGGYIFVANTGGYSFQEGHDYETTVSIVNPETMQVVRTIDTGHVNLYGDMSQAGKYLCINSTGDYYSTEACSIIFDCERAISGNDCCVVLPYAATYSTATRDGKFLAIGSKFSYYTGQYEYNYITIDPALVMQSQGSNGVDEDLPGTMRDDIQNTIAMPYGIYVNPYTGYMYATDAASNASAGVMYQWNASGQLLGKYKTYINPSHIIALPPDGHYTAIREVNIDDNDNDNDNDNAYNLSGQRVSRSAKGIIIVNGKKHINP